MVACVNYFNKVGDGIMVLVKACDLQMVWSSCSFHRTVMFYLHWCKSPLTFEDCNIIVTTTYMKKIVM